MNAAIERIGTILSGLGAACAIPASVAGSSAVVAGAAVALPALGAALSMTSLFGTIREGKRDECARHIRTGIAAAQAELAEDDTYSRIAEINRVALENKVADALGIATQDREEMRGLVVQDGLNGEKIAESLREAAAARDPKGAFTEKHSDESRFFRTVVTVIWQSLRTRPGYYETLRSFIDERVIKELGAIREDTAHIRAGMNATNQRLDRAIEETGALRERLGLREGLVLGIARRYLADESDEFEAALRGIEAALEEAATMRGVDSSSSNTGEEIHGVLAQVQALNDEERLDQASEVLEMALRERSARREREDAGTVRLLDHAVTQGRLTNSPEAVARNLIARLDLDAPAEPQKALRSLFGEWYNRGRDKGIAFDLEVSIELAGEAVNRAGSAQERSWANQALAVAFSVLGGRESDPTRLEQAVIAYQRALEDRSREREPIRWAMTLANLATALHDLGERENGNARLEQSIATYNLALEEWTRERDPMGWAMTQHNLGNALRKLGIRENGTARLEQAVAAHRLSLTERTRERGPREWAATQLSIGNALVDIGQRESNPTKLEMAVASFQLALEETDRVIFPLDWANVQNSLGNALRMLGELENDPVRLEQSVAAYQNALEERKRERVPFDWAMTQSNLGAVFMALGQSKNSTVYFEQAIASHNKALEEYTRERAPHKWMNSQRDLGKVLLTFSQLKGDAVQLQQAVAAFGLALEELNCEREPLIWAETQLMLSATLMVLCAEHEDETEMREEAIIATRHALNVFNWERTPQQWATAKLYLALLIDESKCGIADLEQALAHATEALDVFRKAGMNPMIEQCEAVLSELEVLHSKSRA